MELEGRSKGERTRRCDRPATPPTFVHRGVGQEDGVAVHVAAPEVEEPRHLVQHGDQKHVCVGLLKLTVRVQGREGDLTDLEFMMTCKSRNPTCFCMRAIFSLAVSPAH